MSISDSFSCSFFSDTFSTNSSSLVSYPLMLSMCARYSNLPNATLVPYVKSDNYDLTVQGLHHRPLNFLNLPGYVKGKKTTFSTNSSSLVSYPLMLSMCARYSNLPNATLVPYVKSDNYDLTVQGLHHRPLNFLNLPGYVKGKKTNTLSPGSNNNKKFRSLKSKENIHKKEVGPNRGFG